MATTNVIKNSEVIEKIDNILDENGMSWYDVLEIVKVVNKSVDKTTFEKVEIDGNVLYIEYPKGYNLVIKSVDEIGYARMEVIKKHG